MNKKVLSIILGVVVVILAGTAIYFIVVRKTEPINTQSVIQTNQPLTSSAISQGTVYQNQYIKVTVPTGWILTEATRDIQNQTYDKTSERGIDIGPPIVEKTGAINLTKGNYILYINPRAGQASGVIGGRFEEYAGGAPSVEPVILDHPGGPCGTSDKSTINVNNVSNTRIDYYLSSNDNSPSEMCAAPTDGQTVWYFSDVGGGFNYFNTPNYSGSDSWVATMAYNSKVINSFPIKGSADLNQALTDMSNILKTLTINAPVPYVPAVAQAISTMSNTYWTQATSEGVDSPVESCTDTASTNNISESDVKVSDYMDAENSDRKSMFTSSDTQSRTATVEEILTNNGWTKCNTINEQSPSGASLQTTDAVDVYQNGKDFVDVDSNFAENSSIGIPIYDLNLTFFTLK